MGIYVSLILAGLSVSFFHAILPNHWLPFVLAGRAQQWSTSRTLSMVAVAGGGHVLITTLLGILIVGMGLSLASYVEAWSTRLAAGVLILFGLYHIVRHLRGGGHGHAHGPMQQNHKAHADETDYTHGHGGDGRSPSSDTVAAASVIALLTFSPCEGFLPIYLTAWPYGWAAFFVLSAVLAFGTLSGMLILTGLTYAGVRHMELSWLERYESLVLGGVLMVLGAAVAILHL